MVPFGSGCECKLLRSNRLTIQEDINLPGSGKLPLRDPGPGDRHRPQDRRGAFRSISYLKTIRIFSVKGISLRHVNIQLLCVCPCRDTLPIHPYEEVTSLSKAKGVLCGAIWGLRLVVTKLN